MSPPKTVLPFDLHIMGVTEVESLEPGCFTHACSILDPATRMPGYLEGFDHGSRLDMCFHDVVDEVTGLEAPQASHAAALVAFGASLALATRRPRLLVHCQLGLSRSAAAAMLLVARASPQLSATAVTQAVHWARPEAWPNLRLVALGDVLLGRQGTLVLAAQELLVRQAQRSPMLAKFMEHDGLGRDALRGGVLRPRSLPPP